MKAPNLNRSIRGYVDQVSLSRIAGWAYDSLSPERHLEVQLLLDQRILATVEANIIRPDVAVATNTLGNCGFYCSIDKFGLAPGDLSKIQVLVRLSSKDEWCALPRASGKHTVPQYQSFDGVKGASNSIEKFQALRIHAMENRHSDSAPLKGLSVLDLGCNEGFFCGEALRQGASRVVGIDSSKQFLEKARTRFPGVEFICGSWWDLPSEKFDVILFLSAIHYEEKQRDLLQKIAQSLQPTGTLILECGVGPLHDKAWYTVQRADGLRRYPSFSFLSAELLRGYTIRHMGKSVPQEGDPVPRQVFHCRLKRSTALLISGATNSGKSTLAFTLKERNIPAFHMDVLLNRIIHEGRYGWSKLSKITQSWKGKSALNFGDIGKNLIEMGYEDELLEIVCREAPLEAELFCIEGEILCDEKFRQKLTDRLNKAGIRTWLASSV